MKQVIFFIIFVKIIFCPFEYKHSFKKPILDENNAVPFYEHLGACIPDNLRIRLTPSIQDQKGLVQSKFITTFKWWEVIIDFQIHGQNRVGADGMAFWYTAKKGYLGNVFGRSDEWKGLSVIFDSYDNDHLKNNPMISAFLNNSTYKFDHENDGGSKSIGGCQIDFRNSHFPSQFRVQYYKNKLTAWYLHGYNNHNGSHVTSEPLIHGEENFSGAGIICFLAHNVYLPERGFFGISAMTGGIADDHDIHSLTILSIPEMNDQLKTPSININHNEYDKMIKRFEQEQNKFLKKAGKDDQKRIIDFVEEDDIYTQNLKSIFIAHEQFAKQLELLGKLLLDTKLLIHDQDSRDSFSKLESKMVDFTFQKKNIIEKIEELFKETQKLVEVQNKLSVIKSDLHFISDQIYKLQTFTRKGIGLYTLLSLMLIQMAIFFIIIQFKFTPNRRLEHIYR